MPHPSQLRFAACAACVLLWGAATRGQEAPGEVVELVEPSDGAAPEPAEPADGEELEQDALLTGGWGGLRAALEEQGFSVEGELTLDVSDVAGGGLDQRTTTQTLLDVGISWELQPLLGWDGTVFVEVWTKWGRSLADDVGDYQGSSNIDAQSQSQVAQLWYERWLLPDRLRMKLGKVELFDEFAVVNAAAEFLNNGVTYTPSLFVAPSYPETAWSLGLYALPSQASWFSLALFDGAAQDGVKTGNHGPDSFVGAPSDNLVIAEAGGLWPAADGHLSGRVALGGWHHDGSFEQFDGDGTKGGTSGGYAIFEQALWRERPDDADDAQGVDAFVQLGAADARVSDVSRHAAAGLQWTGPLPERDEDSAGLAASCVSFTNEPTSGYTADHELAVELFYRVQASGWLSIKPDLQWIRHPGGDEAAEDAFVATLRFSAAL